MLHPVIWNKENHKYLLDEHFEGRVNGDCSTVFALSVYMTYKWTGDKAFVDEMWPKVKNATEWQIDRSKQFGLPDHLVSTYDLSGFKDKDLVSYNGFMHMAALQATRELAMVYSDEEFAKRCEQNMKLAQETLKKHLWTGEYFRNWWSKDQEINDDLHIDTQYGQLWSYLLGLGDLMDRDMVRSHLIEEEKAADSPYGLRVLANAGDDRDVTGSDVNNTVWQAGGINWSILNLYLGMDPDRGLVHAEKIVNHWRNKLKDQWNYTDLTSVFDGYPHTNSHYGRQLMFWGIPIALSGQNYSDPDKVLSLSPKVKPPYRLPFFLPGANGVLEAKSGEAFRISLFSGKMKLNELVIDGKLVTRDFSMDAGESIDLNL